MREQTTIVMNGGKMGQVCPAITSDVCGPNQPWHMSDKMRERDKSLGHHILEAGIQPDLVPNV